MKQKYEIDYDVRVVERSLRDKVITKDEHDRRLESLPDVSGEGRPMVIDDDEGLQIRFADIKEDDE